MPDPSALLRSMASAFERVVKSVVRELDHSGELIPVDSLRSSTSFQPYCLLSRRPSSSWFWRPRYTRVNLSIRDILEPDAPEPGTPPGLGKTAASSGPLGSLLPEGSAFSKVLCLGGTGTAGWRASALVLFQLSSVSVPSTSKTLWTGSWRAAWSWWAQDREGSQVGLRCLAAPAPP